MPDRAAFSGPIGEICGLAKLVSKYPTHTFEIDREEAEELFYRVGSPTDSQSELITVLGNAVHNPSDQTTFLFLSAEKKDAEEVEHDYEHSADTGSGEQEHAEATPDNGQEGAEEGIPTRFIKSIG